MFVTHLAAAGHVVELMDQLIPGVNPAIVRPLARRIGGQHQNALITNVPT